MNRTPGRARPLDALSHRSEAYLRGRDIAQYISDPVFLDLLGR